MRRQVVLAAAAPPGAYTALVEALAAAGERAGWLDLEATVPAAGELERAAATGVLRAVAVEPGRVATLKPVRGRPVLADLLREHFRGCLLVLVRAADGLPRLEPDGDGWRLGAGSGQELRRSTTQLVADLGRPSFWRRFDAPPAAASD